MPAPSCRESSAIIDEPSRKARDVRWHAAAWGEDGAMQEPRVDAVSCAMLSRRLCDLFNEVTVLVFFQSALRARKSRSQGQAAASGRNMVKVWR